MILTCLPCIRYPTNYSIYKYKNEVGCRDDTMPKTGDTSSATPKKRDVGRGVAEDCCILSTLPRSAFLCHLFLAQCHPYILLHFYICLTNFFLHCPGPRSNLLFMSMPAHKMHTKWRLTQPETPVEICSFAF